MRSTTNQINIFQIFDEVVWSLVQHLKKILSHVELSTVVDIVTGVPVIGSHNLLKPESPPLMMETRFLDVINHIFAKGWRLFRPARIWVL
jgi:hypothetical protein